MWVGVLSKRRHRKKERKKKKSHMGGMSPGQKRIKMYKRKATHTPQTPGQRPAYSALKPQDQENPPKFQGSQMWKVRVRKSE